MRIHHLQQIYSRTGLSEGAQGLVESHGFREAAATTPTGEKLCGGAEAVLLEAEKMFCSCHSCATDAEMILAYFME